MRVLNKNDSTKIIKLIVESNKLVWHWRSSHKANNNEEYYISNEIQTENPNTQFSFKLMVLQNKIVNIQVIVNMINCGEIEYNLDSAVIINPDLESMLDEKLALLNKISATRLVMNWVDNELASCKPGH